MAPRTPFKPAALRIQTLPEFPLTALGETAIKAMTARPPRIAQGQQFHVSYPTSDRYVKITNLLPTDCILYMTIIIGKRANMHHILSNYNDSYT